MKVLKRLIILVFWAALMFSTLFVPEWKWIAFDENAISVFAWGDIIAPSVIADFERETGIKVHLNFYYSNEELLVKLKATKGKDYDLIIPSDYTVKLLSEEGLLKKIDKSKCPFWDRLDPRLLDLFHDPKNFYSIPYEWEIYGFGIDRDYFKDLPRASWDLVFKPERDYKISMVNDPIDAVEFASFYLFGPKSSLSPEEAKQVQTLLTRQRAWVTAYSDHRGDYLLATKNCPLVISMSSYIGRTMERFPNVEFLTPEEGTFITIENLCIPKPSTKEDLVYKFIDYLYRPEAIATHYKEFHFFPATKNSIKDLEHDPKMASLVKGFDFDLSKAQFMKKLLPARELQELWISVKTDP